MPLRRDFKAFVLYPIFATVAILLVSNSVMIGFLEGRVLSLMKDHFESIGIEYVNGKNRIYQTVLEYQYSSNRIELSVMHTLIRLQLNQKLIHANWDISDVFNKKAIRLNYRQINHDQDQAQYIYYSPNKKVQSDFSEWPTEEQQFFKQYMYLLDIVPRAYPKNPFMIVDTRNGLIISYPISSLIPNYVEGTTTYSPLSQDFCIESLQFQENGYGYFLNNQPYWNQTHSIVPYCAVVDLEDTKQSIAIGCVELDFNEIMNTLKDGMESNTLKNVYSTLIHPVSRELIAQTYADFVEPMTIDSFEFGDNYQKLERYEQFKKDTEFINQRIVIEKNKDRCQFDFYSSSPKNDDVHIIRFSDEEEISYLMVVRDINVCEKNNAGKFNLIRVSYIGTSINISYLHQFIQDKSMTVSILKEISLLVNTAIICGVCLSVAFLGFQFSDKIFIPMNGLIQGMKRVDVDSIKILNQEVNKLPKQMTKNQESLEPLLAYNNILELVSEGNRLYKENELEQALLQFEYAHKIYNYLGNKEGSCICVHNMGIIKIKQGDVKEGISLLESSLYSCNQERIHFQIKCLSQGIKEQEMLTDERYYFDLIQYCRMSFQLIEARMILIRQFQQQNRMSQVDTRKLIDIIQKVIQIQLELQKFGKISSVLVYSYIQLSYFYYLSDSISQSCFAYKQAENTHALFLDTLKANSNSAYSVTILHQLLLVQKGLLEEKLENYQAAALLFTLSIEETEEYKPSGRLEALLGLQRIFNRNGFASTNLNSMLKSYDKSDKDIYFLIDLTVDQDFLQKILELRENIIQELCDSNDKISQLSFTSHKLNINYFQITSNEKYLRNIPFEINNIQENPSCLSMALTSLVLKIEEAFIFKLNQQNNEQFYSIRNLSDNSLEFVKKNTKKYYSLVESPPNFNLNESVQQQEVSSPSLNESLTNIRFQQADNINSSFNILNNQLRNNNNNNNHDNNLHIQQPSKKILFIFSDLSRMLLNQLGESDLARLGRDYIVVMIDLSQEYLNPDAMFNKILLSENLDQYYYFNCNSISNILLRSWKNIFQEPSPQFSFKMEYFQ